MRYQPILFLLVLFLPLVSFAKRLPPPDVSPVVHEGTRYSVLPWALQNGTGQNGGYILAEVEASGEKVWGKQIYQTRYDANLERDAQDVFIVSIKIDLEENSLVVINESGDQYTVSLETRKVARIEESR